MLLKPTDLAHCLRKVQEIDDQYRLQNIGSDDPRRDVSSLVHTVETYLGVKVKILTLDAAMTTVKGAYIRTSEETAEILLSHDLNECWRRFVAAKELFHVILDLPDYRNMDLVGLVEDVTLTFPNDDAKARAATACEFLAELAAMLFLFPLKDRHAALSNTDNSKDIDTFAIATRYKVPKHHVEKSLSKSYMDGIAAGAKHI